MSIGGTINVGTYYVVHSQGQDCRPLSDLEKQLLTKLLSADFSGRDALREQAAVISVRELDQNGSLEFAPSNDMPAEVVRRRGSLGWQMVLNWTRISRAVVVSSVAAYDAETYIIWEPR